MEKIPRYILTGFCTLLFGGMTAQAAPVSRTLVDVLQSVRGRTLAAGMSVDLGKLSHYSESARRALLDEREKV